MIATGATVLARLVRASKVYGTGAPAVHAMRNVDLAVSEGELVTIVGASGSGKSTCLNMLGCLDVPTSGSLGVDGSDIVRASGEQRAQVRSRAIGFVFQGANLIPGMSALRNVELPLIYRGFARAERIARAKAALAAVGLGDRLSHIPAQLSGGQQQRVAIARAIVSRPRLLIADEPTGALDSRTGGEILGLIEELNRARGIAVVMVTHDPAIAERNPRLVVFRDGEVVRDETRWRRTRAA